MVRGVVYRHNVPPPVDNRTTQSQLCRPATVSLGISSVFCFSVASAVVLSLLCWLIVSVMGIFAIGDRRVFPQTVCFQTNGRNILAGSSVPHPLHTIDYPCLPTDTPLHIKRKLNIQIALICLCSGFGLSSRLGLRNRFLFIACDLSPNT